jgi:hypothetical protein
MLTSNEEERGRVYRNLDPGETGAARVPDDRITQSQLPKTRRVKPDDQPQA